MKKWNATNVISKNVYERKCAISFDTHHESRVIPDWIVIYLMRQVTVVSPLNCVFDCIMSLYEMNYHGKAVLKCQTAKVSFTTSVAFGLIKVCKIL